MPNHFCFKPFIGGIECQEFLNLPHSQNKTSAPLLSVFQIGIYLSLLFFCVTNAYCGFRLEPSRALLTDVPLGKNVQTESSTGKLEIHNDDDVSRTFRVEVKKPSEVVGLKRMFGYSGIPKTDYVVTGGKITVGPRSSATVDLGVFIPTDEGNFNRKWEAAVVVTQDEQGMVLSLVGSLWIETKGKQSAGGPLKREREFILSPATLELHGQNDEASVNLTNVSSTTLTLLIVSESPGDEVKGKFIFNSPGFDRLPDEGWVIPVVKGEKQIVRIQDGHEIWPIKKVFLAPGKSVEMNIKLKIPNQPGLKGKKWESYIFARCVEMDETRFVRLRILP